MAASDERLADFVASDGAALLRYAYLLCRDAGRAEDLVQSALERMLRRRVEPDAAHAYARKVITNAFVDWRRLRSSHEVVTDVGLDTQVIDRSDAVAERDAMWQALGLLPPRQRAVLVLRYYEQLTEPEIAAALDCAPATVRSLASRALATLRSHPDFARLPATRQPEET